MLTLVEMHFGSHSDSKDKQTIKKSMERVDEVLRETTGKVYVFLENVALTTPEATNFEKFINIGVRPPLAFAMGGIPATPKTARLLAEAGVRMGPDINKVLKETLDVADFTWTELFNLDPLFLHYMDSSTKSRKSRLGVLFESTADQKGAANTKGFQENEESIYNMVKAGNFPDALSLFQQNSRNMAESALIREELIVNQLTRYFREDVSAVFVRIGSNHTGIYHRLRKMGLDNLSRIFLDQEETTDYYFDPGSAAIRKLMNRGLNSLNEIEWYRGLIGDTTYKLLPAISQELGEDLNDQYMCKIAHNTAMKLETLEDIEALRKRIINTDIVSALADI